jgi:hypothetical protein
MGYLLLLNDPTLYMCRGRCSGNLSTLPEHLILILSLSVMGVNIDFLDFLWFDFWGANRGGWGLVD